MNKKVFRTLLGLAARPWEGINNADPRLNEIGAVVRGNGQAMDQGGGGVAFRRIPPSRFCRRRRSLTGSPDQPSTPTMVES